MYCHNCGAYNDDAALKCEHCGEPFKNDDGVNPFTVGTETTMNDVYYLPAERRNLVSAMRTCLMKWTPRGRASRSEFWYWILFVVFSVVSPFLLATWIDDAFFFFSFSFSFGGHDFDVAEEIGFPGLIWGAICIPPTIFVTIRRLHDVRKTTASFFWVIVPVGLFAAYVSLHDAFGGFLGDPLDGIVLSIIGFFAVLGHVWLLILLCRQGKRNVADVKALRKRAGKKGKSAPETQDATRAENVYCRRCGALNEGNAAFCTQCGASMSEVPEAIAPAAALEKNEVDELAPGRPRSFWGAIWACWNNWSFFGRSSRSEFWYWILFQGIVFINYVASFSLIQTDFKILFVCVFRLTNILWALLLVPTLAVAFRRLHDAGWSVASIFLAVPILPIAVASFNSLGQYNVATVLSLVWLVAFLGFVFLCARPSKIDELYDAEQRLSAGGDAESGR